MCLEHEDLLMAVQSVAIKSTRELNAIWVISSGTLEKTELRQEHLNPSLSGYHFTIVLFKHINMQSFDFIDRTGMYSRALSRPISGFL